MELHITHYMYVGNGKSIQSLACTKVLHSNNLNTHRGMFSLDIYALGFKEGISYEMSVKVLQILVPLSVQNKFLGLSVH
jgi:hypothetical protein